MNQGTATVIRISRKGLIQILLRFVPWLIFCLLMITFPKDTFPALLFPVYFPNCHFKNINGKNGYFFVFDRILSEQDSEYCSRFKCKVKH